MWHSITSQEIHHINDPKATSFFTEKQLACQNKLSLVFHKGKFSNLSTEDTINLHRTSLSSTLPLSAICDEEMLLAVLFHPPFRGKKSNYDWRCSLYSGSTVAPLPSCTLCNFHAPLKGCVLTAEVWHCKVVLSVWISGWQSLTSGPLMERFQLIRHILHLCGGKLQSQKPLPVPWGPTRPFLLRHAAATLRRRPIFWYW